MSDRPDELAGTFLPQVPMCATLVGALRALPVSTLASLWKENLLMESRVSRAVSQRSQAQGAAPGMLGWPTLPLKTPEGFLLP